MIVTREDMVSQVKQREERFTNFILPRLVTATGSRRSSCVSLENATGSTLHLTDEVLDHGVWSVEAPGEVFARGDRIVRQLELED